MNHTSDKGLIESGRFLLETGVLRRTFITSRSSDNGSTGSRQHFTNFIQRVSLRDILSGSNKYTAIFVGTHLSSTVPNTHLIERFWEDTRSMSSTIRRLVIQSACHSSSMTKPPDYVLSQEDEESFYSEEQIEFPNSVCNRVGLYPLLTSYFAGKQPPSVVLFVRPDLYVSHAKLVKDETELQAALQCITTLV